MQAATRQRPIPQIGRFRSRPLSPLLAAPAFAGRAHCPTRRSGSQDHWLETALPDRWGWSRRRSLGRSRQWPATRPAPTMSFPHLNHGASLPTTGTLAAAADDKHASRSVPIRGLRSRSLIVHSTSAAQHRALLRDPGKHRCRGEPTSRLLVLLGLRSVVREPGCLSVATRSSRAPVLLRVPCAKARGLLAPWRPDRSAGEAC